MKERAQGKIEDAQGSLSGLQIPADPADNSETGRKMMFPFKTDWIIKKLQDFYSISIEKQFCFSPWFQLQVIFFSLKPRTLRTDCDQPGLVAGSEEAEADRSRDRPGVGRSQGR